MNGTLKMKSEPWHLAPQLEKDCILEIGQFLVQVRGEVIDRHEPELGDTRLSLGMRAYECCRSRLIIKAKEGDWPWLSILTEEGRFTFAINHIPVRFSRNDPSCLPDRKLILSNEGYKQLHLFKDTIEEPMLRWFFIVDTPYDVPVESAYFVGYSEDNERICQWKIPLSDQLPTMTIVDEDKPQAVKVNPAKAKLKIDLKKKDSN